MKLRTMLSWFSTLLLCVVLLCALPACTSKEDKPLHIATNTWPGYEPLYLARSLGYLAESVQLHEMANSSDVIKAFRNNTVDAACLTLDEVLLLVQDGIDTTIVLVMDISNGADVVLARPGIRSLKEIKGKRVGVESFALGAFMLARALERAGLAPEEVTIVPVTFEMHEQAYLSGKVDAVVTFEPARTRLLEQGASIIFDSSMIPNEIFDVLVVRTEVLKSHPAAVRTLTQGWFKAQEYLRQNPEDAYQRMARRERISAAQFRDSLKRMIIPDADLNRRLLATDLRVSAQRLADFMLKTKLLKTPLDAARLLTHSPQGGKP